MALAVAAAIGVHHPPHEHGEQHESDESTDERPEHAPNYTARAGPPWVLSRRPHGPHSHASSAHAAPALRRVQRALLVRGRERPRNLHLALLAEHEAQLARRAEPLRAVGAVGRARAAARDGAQ